MFEIELLDTLEICPFCQQKTYHRYIKRNGATMVDFPKYVGVCSNDNCLKKCFSPSDYEFAQEQILAKYATNEFARRVKETNECLQHVSKYPMLRERYITASLRNNNLFQYVSKQFGFEEASYAFRLYRVKTHQTIEKWQGSTIFYQYKKDDVKHHIAVKIIQYDPQTGHRISNEDDKIKDEKDLLYQKSFVEPSVYCFFGRHLLDRPESGNKPICIVESEKTALIAAIVYPEAIWMAAGSCYYLYDRKIDSGMEGRKIIIFPDIDVKYEPRDIDEEKGTIRCINWYVIKDGFRNELRDKVLVSGLLDSFISDKCKNCKWKEMCSSSPFYETTSAIIQNRSIGFKLINKPYITSLPKVVLEDKTKEIKCPFRGWDLADYITSERQNLVSFQVLITEIDTKLLSSINNKVNTLEENIHIKQWKDDIRQGIEIIEKNDNNGNS